MLTYLLAMSHLNLKKGLCWSFLPVGFMSAVVCIVILCCSASLYIPYFVWQYFSSEVNSGFFYKSATDRDKLVAAERKFVDDRVKQVVDLKQQVRLAWISPSS